MYNNSKQPDEVPCKCCQTPTKGVCLLDGQALCQTCFDQGVDNVFILSQL